MRFIDRFDAGKRLAEKLTVYRANSHAIVIALPRGGVVTGAAIAHALSLPLDVLVVRKIGAPQNPELALGALTASGTVYFNKQLMADMGVAIDDLTEIINAEKAEAERRERVYRAGKKSLVLKDKIVLLVDDGLATGATMTAALIALKNLGAQKIVVALPVAAPDSLEQLQQYKIDEIVCLHAPDNFYGVGQFYESFAQVSDEEVLALLAGK